VKVLVCGGRDYADSEFVGKVLDSYLEHYPDLAICCGYDTDNERFQGADQLAYEWAGKRDVPRTAYAAAWRKYGRAAGPIRNQHQLSDFEPRYVVAFPGGTGTADMCRRARKKGCSVGYYGPGSRYAAEQAT
jgi:hypothetical protein